MHLIPERPYIVLEMTELLAAMASWQLLARGIVLFFNCHVTCCLLPVATAVAAHVLLGQVQRHP